MAALARTASHPPLDFHRASRTILGIALQQRIETGQKKEKRRKKNKKEKNHNSRASRYDPIGIFRTHCDPEEHGALSRSHRLPSHLDSIYNREIHTRARLGHLSLLHLLGSSHLHCSGADEILVGKQGVVKGRYGSWWGGWVARKSWSRCVAFGVMRSRGWGEGELNVKIRGHETAKSGGVVMDLIHVEFRDDLHGGLQDVNQIKYRASEMRR